MYLIIEEYQYPAEKVEKILDGITNLRNTQGKISVNYVGYYYNPTLKDCVFILPKVLLEVKDGAELVFGSYKPEEILHLEEANLKKEEQSFIYELAVWVYRAIVVFNSTHPDNEIVNQQFVAQMSKGRIRQCNTFLDILLAIQKFNKENQNFFFFVMKNLHSGFNKINWTKTISRSQAIVQDGTPIYLDVVNKKKQINFDEELLVIFFSILNYMHEEYGFPVKIAMGFDLIKGNMFKQYMNGMGCVRLHQIKYKYFSDIALYLWELCYAFFDKSKKINVSVNEQEYLLVSNFNIVFEAIVDDLLGDKYEDDEDLKKLKEQKDGKRVDHMYKYRDLIHNDDDHQIYYIGDSKYYKRSTELGEESVYKQYTYAHNVIQWNIDLFKKKKPEEVDKHKPLRDDLTEGYNIIPNFFISAHQNDLKAIDDIQTKTGEIRLSTHFDDRLYDRDTLILTHYDVNFLFIVSLYGRNNVGQKKAWRDKVQEKVRGEIQKTVTDYYQFYVMEAMPNVDAEAYIRDHFMELNGKINSSPYQDEKHISLALLDPDAVERNKDKKLFSVDLKKLREENAGLLQSLKKAFYVTPVSELDTDPIEAIAQERTDHESEYYNGTWDGKYAIVVDDSDGSLTELLRTDDGFKCRFSFEKDLSLLSDIMKARYAVIKDINGDISVYDMPTAPSVSKSSGLTLYTPLTHSNGSLFGYIAEAVNDDSLVIEFKMSIEKALKYPLIDGEKLEGIFSNYHAETYLPQSVDFKEIVVK